MIKKNIITLVGAAFVIATVLVVFGLSYRTKKRQFNTSNSSQPQSINSINANKKITINDLEIMVELADDPLKRQKGLSGKDRLADNEGMLFVFDQKSLPSFWMINMKFPIDIIWIEDDKVVGVEKNVPYPKLDTAESELPLYYPPGPINYVLEVNAGYSDDNNIQTGDSVLYNF